MLIKAPTLIHYDPNFVKCKLNLHLLAQYASGLGAVLKQKRGDKIFACSFLFFFFKLNEKKTHISILNCHQLLVANVS